MKKILVMALGIINFTNLIFADTHLAGVLGDSKGESVLTMNTPIVFAGAMDPDGRRILLGIELIKEADSEVTLQCTISIEDKQGQRSQLTPTTVVLKWGVDADCLFPVNDTQALSMRLTALPSFLVAPAQ